MEPVHVLKFGGTSLKNSFFINQAVQIIAEHSKNAQTAVVASAVDGVTNKLADLALVPHLDLEKSSQIVNELQTFHFNLFDELIGQPDPDYHGLTFMFEELQQVVQDKSSQNGTILPRRDRILSFGERFSVRLLAAALNKRGIDADFIDAHHFIKTDAAFGQANVLEELTRNNIWKSIHLEYQIPVITGFIGSDQRGNITTLGRSGSDYTASLVADALQADRLEIWTDVNGVHTADPNVVPAAQTIGSLNFDDVAELADHGLGVLHPKTIQPIRNHDISLRVRNSQNLEHPGTIIKHSIPSNGNFRFVTIDGPFVYLEVQEKQAAMIQTLIEEQAENYPGPIDYLGITHNESAQFLIQKSVFGNIEPSLHRWNKEHGNGLLICEDIYKAKKFTNTLRYNDTSLSDISEILSRRNIRPLAITRNYKQRHIQLLLSREEAYEAARAINDHPQKQKKVISLFIAGIGAVGGTLRKQLETLNHLDFDLQIMGYCNSKNVWLQGREYPTDWPAIIRELSSSFTTNTIFVDATGSGEVARIYPRLFEAGLHIVTPSKLANTFEQSFYEKLREKAAWNNVHFKYETTVGAGLPVISTIQNLQAAGDRITEISGVVSGTMTYIFDRLRNGISFCEAVIEARAEGYAEPDPRDDLSGEDVARKFLTLAREMGKKIERSELQVSSLVPDELASVDAETFLKRLPEFDACWAEKLEHAKKNNAALQYAGSFNGENISVGLQEVPQQSPLGQLEGSNNLIRISSKIYHKNPLIIQGPGAGKDVTASGVLSDILNIAEAVLSPES
jgi:aspartokinase/homoserine dehydrogenase 1